MRNYRIWFVGALVSNIGTWVQRTAQDWIVINDLTHNDALAVGIVMALQFGPQLLLMPVTGFAADHFTTRKLLIITQAAQAVLAAGLGLTVLTGHATLWHVYGFALLLGIVAAFDSPPRQTFVSQLVGETYLGNAVSLNSASFNIARMLGPAVAGLLIAAVGAGWSFVLNAASFAAVLVSLFFIRPAELHVAARASRGKGQLAQGLRYIVHRPDLIGVMMAIAVAATFTLNFPVYISAMTTTAFHLGSSQFGGFNSALAVGSVVGALLAARRERPQMHVVIYACLTLGVVLALTAVTPNALTFALMLPLSGMAMQMMTTSANGYVQMSTAPYMRGRVMAVYMAVSSGGTPIGAPIMGWIANVMGPRASVMLGALASVLAGTAGLAWLSTHLRLSTGFVIPFGGPRVRIVTAPRAHPGNDRPTPNVAGVRASSPVTPRRPAQPLRGAVTIIDEGAPPSGTATPGTGGPAECHRERLRAVDT